MSLKISLLIIIHLYLIALYAQISKSDNEIRLNSSNSNNNSTINSNRLDILSSRDRPKTCPGAHIRNDLKSFDQLRGCNIIDGPLTIALVSNQTHPYKPEDYENLSFPHLFEITEYLLFFRVQGLSSLSKLFPNLAVIRGKVLVSDYAFVIYEMMHLQQIDLPKLSDILRGSVRVESNPNLCYATTVNWEAICKNSFNPHFIKNNNQRCNNRCPNHCRPWNSRPINLETKLQGDVTQLGASNNRSLFCWNSKDCHEMCQAPDGTYLPLGPNGGCCSPQCAGGCHIEDRSDQCISCRSVSQQGKCVEHCDHSLYEYRGTCISEPECLKTTTIPQNQDLCGKASESHMTNPKAIRLAGEKHGRCQAECPTNYEEDPTNKSKCKPCDKGRCRKICTLTNERKAPFMVKNVNNLRAISGCNSINGSLEIALKGGKNVLSELEAAFQDLEEIGGYLKITRSYPILTLGFLSKLRAINGSELDRGQYSLVIVDNPNLQELFMFNQSDYSDTNQKPLSIVRGKIFAHLNPKLCLYRINNLKSYSSISDWDERDVHIHTNGDKEACSKDKLEVDVVRSKPNYALIRFQNYASKMTDPRSLLYYLINYREVKSGTVTMFDGRDGCNSQNDLWTTLEEPPISEKSDKYQEAVIKVKPATGYALYVKTFTLFVESTGALSDIIYFETAPDTPGIPRAIQGYSENFNSVFVSWSPPSKPNGVVKMYSVTITKSVEPLENLQDTDICLSTGDRGKITQALTKEEQPQSFFSPPGQPNNGTNVNESPPVIPNTCQLPTSDINVDIQTEVLTFQDLIIDLVYLKQQTCSNSVTGKNLKRRSIEYESTVMTNTNLSPSLRLSQSAHENPNNNTNNNSTSNEKNTSKQKDIIPTPLKIKFDPYASKTEANVTSQGGKDGKVTYLITGLEHFTSYTIEVAACHGDFKSNSSIIPLSTYKKCGIHAITQVRTLPVDEYDKINPESIMFHRVSETNTHNRITWDRPRHPNGLILAYKVRYRPKNGDLFWTEVCINNTAYNRDKGFILSNLGAGTYVLNVQAITMYSMVGQRFWSEPDVEFEIQPEYPISPLALTTSVVITLLLIALAVASGTYYYQKNRDKLKYASVNPDYAVYVPDKWEVCKDDLIIEEQIGTGAFGMVYKGMLKTPEGTIKCAIKTVPSTSTPKQRVDFLREASIMKQFDTYHVVKLMGVVSITAQAYVIMEYMGKGDLKGYLRRLRDAHHLEKKWLVDGIYLMAAQIADGMAYLASKRFVHRDLAARNCMVGEDGVVKIGDFGLTRDIYDNDYYRRDTHGRLPVRWMAPESLRDNLYTSASDVWSYGVVVWEIVTFSESPYQGLSNDEVIKSVMQGVTMSRPQHCPDKLYYIMQRCWRKLDKERPSFEDIVEYLLPLIEDKLYPNYFYKKRSVEGIGDSINIPKQDATIDETNASGAESFPLLSWPSNCANGESMTHIKSNGNVIQ